MFYRKRKSPTVESKYGSYHNFYFARRVTLEDVQWGFNFVVENARIVDLEVDWLFLGKNSEKFRTLNYPVRVDDHELLADIAEILHDIMKVDPSLFGFCMFSFLPNEILKMIIEAHVKNQGGLNCRAVNKKWRDVATNEKYFPGLKDRDLVNVHEGIWDFFKDLYAVNLAQGGLGIGFFGGNDKLLARLTYDEGLVFKKMCRNCNFTYPPEIQKVVFYGHNAIGKAMRMHGMDYAYASPRIGKFEEKHKKDTLLDMLGISSWRDFHAFIPRPKMMANSRIRRIFCDLYRKHVLQTE
jgi:hypothetical protein